eukprot:TRINITY_DN18162_c1_g2_i1.p1 TRINITY_DN18162_c1_g2~~TRINITY_DN18162_c1_g2_i1.p1  ORF type:complete len:480 (+),score=84.78 TRINITY_DN18162_c1_g2_i1:59-1441(+)
MAFTTFFSLASQKLARHSLPVPVSALQIQTATPRHGAAAVPCWEKSESGLVRFYQPSQDASGAVTVSIATGMFVGVIGLMSSKRRKIKKGHGSNGCHSHRNLLSIRARVKNSAIGSEGSETESGRAACDGDAVLLHYKVTMAKDGSVVDCTEGRDPLSFVLGKGRVMKGMESATRGLSVGDKATMTLPPELAYGQKDERLIFELPKQHLPPAVKVGSSVNLRSGGKDFTAQVLYISEDADDKGSAGNGAEGSNGIVKLDANHVLAGETLELEVELVGFRQQLADSQAPPGMELATFAAGCFWGVELAFQRLPGVVSTCVGYTQGSVQSPEYKEVCEGKTGHTEAVHVVFDPKIVTFEKLLETFWERVGKNATTLNEAGGDKGPQYRSGIYCHTEEQQRLAERSALELQMKLKDAVVTEVKEASLFWIAEDYHQKYLERGGNTGRPQSAEKGCSEPIRCYG